MAKNDDAPPIIPDTSHLGEDFENMSRPGTSISESSIASADSSRVDAGYFGGDVRFNSILYAPALLFDFNFIP